MRENKGYYNGSAIGCVSSFCWIIERKDWLFKEDIAQTGSTTYIYVCLFLCVFCVYIFAILYVFHCSVIYNILTTVPQSIGKITKKPLWREITKVSPMLEVKEKGVASIQEGK